MNEYWGWKTFAARGKTENILGSFCLIFFSFSFCQPFKNVKAVLSLDLVHGHNLPSPGLIQCGYAHYIFCGSLIIFLIWRELIHQYSTKLLALPNIMSLKIYSTNFKGYHYNKAGIYKTQNVSKPC